MSLHYQSPKRTLDTSQVDVLALLHLLVKELRENKTIRTELKEILFNAQDQGSV